MPGKPSPEPGIGPQDTGGGMPGIVASPDPNGPNQLDAGGGMPGLLATPNPVGGDTGGGMPG